MRWLWLASTCLWAQDTLRIDPRKKLRPYELERKKPGWVFTGYPAVGYDPLRGPGAALAIAVAYNGQKTDKTFSIQPYKQYFFTQAGGFLKGSLYARFFYDMPWLGGRPYRLMLRASYRNEPTGQLWGLGQSSLAYTFPGTLSKYETRLQEPTLVNGQWTTQKDYHAFLVQQWQLWAIGERIAYRGLLRLMGGVRWQQDRASSLTGETYTLKKTTGEQVEAVQLPTLLDSLSDAPPLPNLQLAPEKNQPRLFTGGAVVWDSRDFEVNPNAGWVIEAGHESRIPTLSTHKTFLSLRTYHTLYRTSNEKIQLTGALHFLTSATYGPQIYFIDLYTYNRWSEGRSLNLLSGPSTLRAFREGRFVLPVAYLLQYELRSRIAEVRFLKQHFVGGPVLFGDIATGTNTPKQLPTIFRTGIGVGARILWNMTTVLRGDVAYGREGFQLHFTTSHPF